MRDNRTGLPIVTALMAAVAVLASAALLSGCMTKDDDRTAGVDEFPNSIYARVNGFLDEGKKSEAINSVPSLTDSLLVQPGFNVAAGKVAGKIAAAAASGNASAPLHGLAQAGIEPGCTSGIITATDTVKASLKYTVDTLSVCLDAKALDSTQGNETIVRGRSVTTYSSGRVETADISDADGDGILNPKSAAAKANIVFTASEKGVLERTVLVVGPGPDMNFDTEADNLVYSASWSKTSGTDTLGTAVYADADSDGVAIDNGKASVVDLDFYQQGPSADHPEAVWTRARMRLVVRYQAEAKEVRRVRFEMEDKDGRRQTGEVLNAQGGIYFDMKDTVQAHFVSLATSPADTLDSSDVHLIMGLGKDFDDKGDDSIYAMDVRTVKKLGEERDAHFSFLADKPIPSGRDPQSGTLSMQVDYIDNTSIQVDGKITPATLDVVFKDRTGKRLHVVWDREGRGISLERIQ